jgi:hypothetical protein
MIRHICGCGKVYSKNLLVGSRFFLERAFPRKIMAKEYFIEEMNMDLIGILVYLTKEYAKTMLNLVQS